MDKIHLKELGAKPRPYEQHVECLQLPIASTILLPSYSTCSRKLNVFNFFRLVEMVKIRSTLLPKNGNNDEATFDLCKDRRRLIVIDRRHVVGVDGPLIGLFPLSIFSSVQKFTRNGLPDHKKGPRCLVY